MTCLRGIDARNADVNLGTGDTGLVFMSFLSFDAFEQRT